MAGGEERIQDEAQVPVTGDRVGGGAVPEIGGGVDFIYSFFMHSFIKKKKKDIEPLLCARQCSRFGVYISEQNRQISLTWSRFCYGEEPDKKQNRHNVML